MSKRRRSTPSRDKRRRVAQRAATSTPTQTTPHEPTAAPPVANPTEPIASQGPGRPRFFDDATRREVCALVSGGCSLPDAASYVGCSMKTLRRECRRDQEFHVRLCRARATAALDPLHVMKQAASVHWRAAAWMLERSMPSKYGRPDPKRFGKSEARRLAKDLAEIVRSESAAIPTAVLERLETRIAGAIEYATRTAIDTNRSGKKLRAAMKFFDAKNRSTSESRGPEPLVPTPPHLVPTLRVGTHDAAAPQPLTPSTPLAPAPEPLTPSTPESRAASPPGAPSIARETPLAPQPCAERGRPDTSRSAPSARDKTPSRPRSLPPEMANIGGAIRDRRAEISEREFDSSLEPVESFVPENALPIFNDAGPDPTETELLHDFLCATGSASGH